MIHKFINKNNLIYYLFFFSQICSIRFFLNSSFFNKDINFYYIYIFISSIIFYFLISKKLIDFFLSNKVLYLVLFLFFIFLLINYPIQENLKLYLQGSDQDNCYIDIANNIINNNKLIYTKSYLGNPCSTGLLAFIFYFPVLFWQNYFVVVPIIFLFLFKKCNFILLNDEKLSNLLTFILIGNLVFLELSVSGSDFISISISYVAGNVFLKKGLSDNKKLYIYASFIFFLFFFGSRSVLLVLIIPLFFIYYFKYQNYKIITFFAILFITTLLSYLMPYYILSPNEFPPFHLISKAYWYFDNIKYILMFTLISILIFLLFFKDYLFKINNLNFSIIIMVILIIPLLISSFSGLVYNLNQLSKWEELNYIYLFTPALLIFSFSAFKKE